MKINPYLGFQGQAEEAFKFYETVLRGKIVANFKYADHPDAPPMPAEMRDRMMHVALQVGDSVLMGGDAPPGHNERPQGFNVNLALQDTAEAERIYAELSQGGTITMPIQQTFWSVRFAMFTDRFGVPWMINCEGAKK